VVALEPTETVTLSRAVFEEARRSHPELVNVVNRLLAATVERLSQSLLEAMYLGVDERVARRLVELAEIYRSGTAPVVVPITQDDLAGMAGHHPADREPGLGKLADAGRCGWSGAGSRSPTSSPCAATADCWPEPPDSAGVGRQRVQHGLHLERGEAGVLGQQPGDQAR
jgi:hypothetical protein